jgi:hypothetical protein
MPKIPKNAEKMTKTFPGTGRTNSESLFSDVNVLNVRPQAQKLDGLPIRSSKWDEKDSDETPGSG